MKGYDREREIANRIDDSRLVFIDIKNPIRIFFNGDIKSSIEQSFGGGGRKSCPLFKLFRLAA